MTELDLEYRNTGQYNYLDINLKIIRSGLTDYCRQYKDDAKMNNCKEIVLEFYDAFSDKFRDPAYIEIFDSQKEIRKRQGNLDYDKFTPSEWEYHSSQIVIIEIYENNAKIPTRTKNIRW